MSSGATVSWIALLLVLIVVLLAVGGVVALIIVLVRRSKGAEGDSGTCGKCGYRVTGLTTFTCPECGADLREVGIAKTSSNNGVMWALIIAGGLAVLILLCLCAGVFSFRGSSRPMPVPAPVATPAVPEDAEAPQLEEPIEPRLREDE